LHLHGFLRTIAVSWLRTIAVFGLRTVAVSWPATLAGRQFSVLFWHGWRGQVLTQINDRRGALPPDPPRPLKRLA